MAQRFRRESVHFVRKSRHIADARCSSAGGAYLPENPAHETIDTQTPPAVA